ncbi:MAG: hypothetical protein WCG87_13420, partial [Bacteroidota bacterium]
MEKRCIFLLILFIVCRVVVYAQTITTFAGGGLSLVNNTSALLSNIHAPLSGAFDKYGNYYFATGIGNSSVKKVNINGLISTIAGNGSDGFSGDNGLAVLAQMHGIMGIAIDTNCNVYIADYYNARIRKVDAITGIITTFAGNGVHNSLGDNGSALSAALVPENVSADRFGNIYVLDSVSVVRKINASGIINSYAGISGFSGYSGDNGPATSAQIAYSYGLCNDTAGNLYIGCVGRIRKVNKNTGVITTVAGNGNEIYIGDGMPALQAQFDPYQITTDLLGNIYMVDEGNFQQRALQISAAGIFHAIAGNGTSGYSGDNGPAISAQLYNPAGVTTDSCGNVYIADAVNHRIRKVWIGTTTIPSASIDVSPNDTVCTGTSVIFTATPISAGSNPTYQWLKNGVVVSTATNSTYTYSPTNGDSIQCIVVSSIACAGPALSNAIHMTVTPSVIPTISVSPNPNDTVCATTSVTYTATTTNGGTTPIYQWVKNGVNVGTNSATYNYTPNNLDSIRCVLTSNATCATPATLSSNTINMTVNPLLIPTIS